jgi:hypothetical protein
MNVGGGGGRRRKEMEKMLLKERTFRCSGCSATEKVEVCGVFERTRKPIRIQSKYHKILQHFRHLRISRARKCYFNVSTACQPISFKREMPFFEIVTYFFEPKLQHYYSPFVY